MHYVLVSGKREFVDYQTFCKFMKYSLHDVTDAITIIEGGASGADALAKRYAKEQGYELLEFKAKWNLYGKMAGPIRNGEMVSFAAAKEHAVAIFFWDGKSPGTGNCLSQAKRAGLQCEVCRI